MLVNAGCWRTEENKKSVISSLVLSGQKPLYCKTSERNPANIYLEASGLFSLKLTVTYIFATACPNMHLLRVQSIQYHC